MKKIGLISEHRKLFHASLLMSVLKVSDSGVPSNADKASKLSIAIAAGIVQRIKMESQEVPGERLAGQTSGNQFELICAEFVQSTFNLLSNLRPGNWETFRISSRNSSALANYEQYAHLAELQNAVTSNPELAAILGNDYTITPDIVVTRKPEPDDFINSEKTIVDASSGNLTSIREAVNSLPILHASISCKWTMRSDRAQNARSEALNLIRNRKGRLPHILVVTAEPMPSRLSSLALGTGDIDCVYHFALKELVETVQELANETAIELLDAMINGKRLKDIADLPLDLAV